jgi:APA family basic amino acid/polyamine antiporter
VFDIAWFADLSNIGTLFAFILVSAGVIVQRKKQPDRSPGFRVPLVPLLPGISIFCCLVLMLSLPLETWLRFAVWLVIGLFAYFSYGRKRTAELARRRCCRRRTIA